MTCHRLTPVFLAEIARQWNAHVNADWPPTRAIAVAHGVAKGTARNWANAARQAGLHLEPCRGLRHRHAADGGGQQ